MANLEIKVKVTKTVWFYLAYAAAFCGINDLFRNKELFKVKFLGVVNKDIDTDA